MSATNLMKPLAGIAISLQTAFCIFEGIVLLNTRSIHINNIRYILHIIYGEVHYLYLFINFRLIIKPYKTTGKMYDSSS